MFMRKKYLNELLTKAQARIETLEDIICPAQQHKWFADYEQECYICTRCRKVRWMDIEIV